MSIIINGTEIGQVLLNNNKEIGTVRFNGVTVFEASTEPATPNEYFTFTLLSDNQNYSIKAKNVANMPADVVLPSKYEGLPITTIAYEGFKNCKTIKTLIISNKITDIDDYAFQNCTSLTNVKLPSNLEYLGKASLGAGGSIFSNCSSLTTINIKDCKNLKAIANGAFSGCSKLLNIEIPSNVEFIGNSAFENCDAMTYIQIPASVTTIGSNIFRYSTGFQNIIFSSKSELKSINSQTFWGCNNLTSIKLPPNLEILKASALRYCSILPVIELPQTITTIEASCFEACRKLMKLIIRATTPPTLGTNAFNGVPQQMQILVPATSVEAYKAAAGWSDRAAYIAAIPE